MKYHSALKWVHDSVSVIVNNHIIDFDKRKYHLRIWLEKVPFYDYDV